VFTSCKVRIDALRELQQHADLRMITTKRAVW
jgi:hypothetical protein